VNINHELRELMRLAVIGSDSTRADRVEGREVLVRDLDGTIDAMCCTVRAGPAMAVVMHRATHGAGGLRQDKALLIDRELAEVLHRAIGAAWPDLT